jgi:phenylacetate-CoA ligase
VRYASEILNTMSQEQIKRHQEKLLRQQIRYCYSNSEFYRDRFREIGVEPEDIQTLDDFFRLPILMDKDKERESQSLSMEREGHPFGMHLCSDPADVALTATTSGTTGLPTFTYTLGRADVPLLNDAIRLMLGQAGVGWGDRVLFAHALGIYATSAVLPPLRNSGILPIDVDVRGGADMILKFAQMTRPVAAMMTPSLAQHLISRIPQELGCSPRDLGWRALFVVGEVGVGIPEVKQKIEDAYGCRVYDWIAPVGQTIAFSCDCDQYHGMHAVTPDTDLYPMDLVDPETKDHLPIKNGVVGEAVYTSLRRKTLPVLRYGSGDIVRVNTHPCPGCGFTGARVEVIGRSDDMLIVKGVNVYPAAIKQIINEFRGEVSGEFRIVLNTPPPRVAPPLHIKVELSRDMTVEEISSVENRMKAAMHQKLRLTPTFEWVPAGSLPLAVAKTPLFEKVY